jgi:hypothetical protein
MYNDAGNMRLAVAVDITKAAVLPADLLKQEKTFVTDATFLFLNEKPDITMGSFGSGVYKDTKIRFFNVNNQITLSIDYALSNNRLIIATSKNTMRSLLDTLSVQKIEQPSLPTGQSISPTEQPASGAGPE